MRMNIMKALVVAVALFGFTAASAQEYVTVERRSSPAGTIMRDTIAGAVLGSAVAGGIILYNMGIEDDDDYDWGRTLAWGAVIGLGTGLVFGIVDATTDAASYGNVTKVHVRDGNSVTLDARRRDQSGKELFPVLSHRF